MAIPCLKRPGPGRGTPTPYVSMSDWAGFPFIMSDIRMNTGQYVRMLFDHYHLTPNTVLEIASLQYIYSAVRRGIGITIAPVHAPCPRTVRACVTCPLTTTVESSGILPPSQKARPCRPARWTS